MGDGIGRRGLLITVGVAGAVVALALATHLLGWWRVPVGDGAYAAGPAVRSYFGELAGGSKIDRWTLVQIYDVQGGAIPVLMATADGTRFQVDLLKRDPAGPRGVAETTQLSLFVANGADGNVKTPEEQAQGVVALAAKLTQREQAGAKPPELATLKERKGAGRSFLLTH